MDMLGRYLVLPFLVFGLFSEGQSGQSIMTSRDPIFGVKLVREELEQSNRFMSEVKLSEMKIYMKQFTNREAGELKSLLGDSKDCILSLMQLESDMTSLKPYTLQMLDSWGKPPSGIMSGDLQWEGRYYECQKASTDTFSGKWCSLMLGSPTQSAFGIPSSPGLSLGSCLPNTCSQEDITTLLQTITNSSLSTVVYCPTQPTNYTAVDIISLLICSILGILVIGGTLYELHYNARKDQQYESILSDRDNIPTMDDSRPSVLVQILMSFSLIQNTKLLMDTSQREGNINVLHGLRFISMTWVILGHTFFFSVSYVENPLDFAEYFVSEGSFQAIANAFFSVDTFFFLSGLLATYLGMRDLNRRDGKINIGLLYLYRYLRLTPAYAFCILLSSSIYSKMGDGPFWPSIPQTFKMSCGQYWWTNLLYINNLYPAGLGEECFAHSWYLANDTQFFLLVPFLLMLLYKKPKLGVAALGIGTLISIMITFSLSLHYKEQPMPVGIAVMCKSILNMFGSGQELTDFMGNATTPAPPPPGVPIADQEGSDLYAKPWCRIGVYLIGMATGYLLHCRSVRMQMNKVFVACMWVLAIVTGFSLVYGLWSHVNGMYALPNGVAAFYNAVSRPLWGMCLAWIVIASVKGYGGPINTFLSWKAFIPLSRLTYCAYLVHPLIMYWAFGIMETHVHFSASQMALYFLGFVPLSYGVAFAVSMIIEMPVIGIMKVFFKGKQSPKVFKPNERSSLLTPSNSETSYDSVGKGKI